MKRFFAFFVLLFISASAFSQVNINLKDAARYSGDSVVVCGKIFTTRNFSDTLVLLNMGAAFPNQQLTLVIKGDAIKEFKEAPDSFFKNKDVCVFGRISMYKEKPQIVLYHETQIMEAISK